MCFNHTCRWPQWSSGSSHACGVWGPSIKLRCGQKCLCSSRKSLRYAALGTGCTLTAVPRLTRPSTLWGTVNEYQPYGPVLIQMAMGECSAYSSVQGLQADSKVRFAVWPTSWRPPGTDRLSSMWLEVNSPYSQHYRYHPGTWVLLLLLLLILRAVGLKCILYVPTSDAVHEMCFDRHSESAVSLCLITGKEYIGIGMIKFVL